MVNKLKLKHHTRITCKSNAGASLRPGKLEAIPQGYRNLRRWLTRMTQKGHPCRQRAKRFLYESKLAIRGRSLGTGGKVKYERYRALRAHYVAIREAYVLRFGLPKADQPRNYKTLKGFIALLTRLIREGPKPLKEFSHECRRHALLKQTNERAADKEFLASTVGRSVSWKVTKTKLDDAVREALAIWGERRIYKMDTESVASYIRVLPITPIAEEDLPMEPIPTNKSCLTVPSKKGGAAVGLVERTWILAAQKYNTHRTQQLHGYAMKLRDSQGKRDEHKKYLKLQSRVKNFKPEMPDMAEVREMYELCEPALRPHPLAEMGGKVRVVTLHPAEEVYMARWLTSFWLKSLKKCMTTASMLRGKKVELRAQGKNAKLYSADLSKATDYIPHEVARAFAKELCKKLKRPQDYVIVEKLFSGKTLPDGSTTVNGVHMGLGPSWVILSLINGYAAWMAGARRDSHHICGDDLVGYWSEEIRDDYVRNLERLGLKINKAKSFYGRRAVFCERIIRVHRGGIAKMSDVGHLSAITAAKYVGGYSRNGLPVADSLRKNGILRHVSDRVRRSLVPCRAGPGPVKLYGNGFGDCGSGALKIALEGGPGLVMKPSLPEGLMREINSQSSKNVDVVPVSKLIIEVKTAIHAKNAIQGCVPEVKPLPKGQFKRYARLARKKVCDKDLLELVRASQLSRKNKKTIRFLISYSPSPKRYQRAAMIALRGPAERYLDELDADDVIKDYTGLDWTTRLERRFTKKVAPSGPSLPWEKRKNPAL